MRRLQQQLKEENKFTVSKFLTVEKRTVPEQCAGNEYRRSRFVNPDSPEALTIFNDSMMSLINAKPHKSTTGVIDGFIVWECIR